MRLFVAIFVAVMFLSAAFRPNLLPFIWGGALPVWWVILWRWRCWNCGDRLMKDGASHLEMNASGPVKHKTCGADLR